MDGAAGEPDELARSNDGDDEFEPRRRGWVRPVAWVAVVGLVLGGAFSSALTLLGHPSSSRPPAKGTVVSQVVEERGRGSGTVAIQTPPEGATALAVRFTCLSPGSFSWGIDPVKNPGSSCSEARVGSSVWNEFHLPDLPQLYITAAQDAEWSVQVMYVRGAEGPGV
jgi:hypothetical protein